MTPLDQSVFSKAFPGPTMPWSNNPSLELRDMYDQVYSHLISCSPHRDTMLQVLGQIIIAKDMRPRIDIIGSPANTTPPDRIETILGLGRGAVLRAIADVRMTLRVGYTNITIQDQAFQEFLLDSSRSKGLSVDLNDARLTLQLAAPIRKVFGAQGMCMMLSMHSLGMTPLIHQAFSRVFPGPDMPWNDNSSIQLQDMYDRVYTHLIVNSPHRDTILQVLGQVIVAKDMPPVIDASGIPANFPSPKRIAAILGLEYDLVMQLVTEFHPILEGGDEHTDIKIRQPYFLEFLLDPSRSQELFINVNEALLIVRHAPTLRTIFDTEGM